MNVPALQIPANGLDSLVSDFLAFLDVSRATAQAYTKGINKFLVFMHDREIGQPRREDILGFRDDLAKSCMPATVQLHLCALKRFFSWLEMRGIYPDIARSVKSPKVPHNVFRKDALTSSQAKELLESIDRSTVKGKRDYALLALMLTTGLRDIEVARADVADIRPVGDNVVLFVQGKGRDGKDAYVKIASLVEKAIRDWLIASEKKDGPVFCSLSNRSRERLTTRSISRIVKNAILGIGLASDRLTAHSLRHTAATLNLLHGGTLEETQQMLRHSSITTTMIYSHHLQRASNNSELRVADCILG